MRKRDDRSCDAAPPSEGGSGGDTAGRGRSDSLEQEARRVIYCRVRFIGFSGLLTRLVLGDPRRSYQLEEISRLEIDPLRRPSGSLRRMKVGEDRGVG